MESSTTRAYWAQIPNIVFELGLTPYEFTMYAHFRRTAGESGECWKSTETLADETGMSAGMVSKVKESLAKPRTALNGKTLITVDPRANPYGGKQVHVVKLVDIWECNQSRFSQSSSPHELASSQDERTHSPHELASSPHETKKNSLRRTKEEKQKKKTEGANGTPPSPPVSEKLDAKAETTQPQAITANDVAPSPDGAAPPPPARRKAANVHPFVEAYREVFHRYPSTEQKILFLSRLEGMGHQSLEAWQKVCKTWLLRGNKVTNLDGMLEWLRDGIPDYPRPARASPQGSGGHGEYTRAAKQPQYSEAEIEQLKQKSKAIKEARRHEQQGTNAARTPSH